MKTLKKDELFSIFQLMNFPKCVNFEEIYNLQFVRGNYLYKPSTGKKIPDNHLAFLVLHEICHFAIKPDWYILRWDSKKNERDSIPDLKTLFCHFSDKDYCLRNPGTDLVEFLDDDTPDEWGARALGIYLIDVNSWRVPKFRNNLVNPRLFTDTLSLTTKEDGFSQLKRYGMIPGLRPFTD